MRAGIKEQADKLVDKGPAEKMGDKVVEKKDEVIRNTLTRPLR